MNKFSNIKFLVSRILVTTLFTLIISFLWINVSTTKAMETDKLLGLNENLVIVYNNDNTDNEIYMMKDSEALKEDANIITVINNNTHNVNLDLLIRINKNSSLDLSYVKYFLNGVVMSFDKIYLQDSLYYYYKLGSVDVDANGSLDNDFYLWLKEGNVTDLSNKTFSYSIVFKENNSLVYN